jgi:hypothetical protein
LVGILEAANEHRPCDYRNPTNFATGGIIGLVGAFMTDHAAPYAEAINLTKQLGQNPSDKEQVFKSLVAKWAQLIEINKVLGKQDQRPLIDEQMRQAFAAVAGNAEVVPLPETAG